MDLVRLLESYRGRDKIVRLCSYVGMLIGGSGDGNFHKRALIIAQELGAARMTMRLFDDLSMLFSNLRYGSGSQEKNMLIRAMSLVTNASYQLFFPVEHVYWLCDKKILTTFVSWKWVVGSILCWAVALLADIIKILTKIITLRKELKELKKHKALQSSEESEEQVKGDKLRDTAVQLQESYLTLIQNLADFMNAISWLPPGLVLWSGKLSRFQNGVFGLISSSIMLYKAWPSKPKQS